MQGHVSDQRVNGGWVPSLIIAGAAAFWGLYWIPLRETEALGVPPLWSVALFNMPLVLVSGVVFLWFFRSNRHLLGQIILAGVLAGAGLALYGMGLMLTTVVRATLLFYLTPVWGTLIGIVVLGERPGLRRWFALTLGIAGLILTIGLTPDDLNLVFGAGEVVGLASGLVWAAAATVIRRSEGLPATGLAFFQFATAFIVTSVFAISMGEGFVTAEIIATALNWYLITGAICHVGNNLHHFRRHRSGVPRKIRPVDDDRSCCRRVFCRHPFARRSTFNMGVDWCGANHLSRHRRSHWIGGLASIRAETAHPPRLVP